MRIAIIFGCNLFQDTISVNGIVEALMEKARILEACCEWRFDILIEVGLRRGCSWSLTIVELACVHAIGEGWLNRNGRKVAVFGRSRSQCL